MRKFLLFATAVLLATITNAQTFNSTLETSYGGNRADEISAIKKADNGSIFVAGRFGGTVDFDPGPVVFNLTSNGTPPTNNAIGGARIYTKI